MRTYQCWWYTAVVPQYIILHPHCCISPLKGKIYTSEYHCIFKLFTMLASIALQKMELHPIFMTIPCWWLYIQLYTYWMAGICLLISQFWPRVDIERTKSGLFPAQLLLVDSSVMEFLLFDFPIFSHSSGLNILHPPRASPNFQMVSIRVGLTMGDIKQTWLDGESPNYSSMIQNN